MKNIQFIMGMLSLICSTGLLAQVDHTSTSTITIQKTIPLTGGEQNQQFTLYKKIKNKANNQSKTAPQEYLIQVYQPKTPAPDGGYSVIYLLDGNASFPYASIIAQAMDKMAQRTKKIPPVIVAIGYPHADPFDFVARAWDYTPPYTGKFKPSKENDHPQGGAEQFFQFIEYQLKPIIESHYTINKNKQILFGHSYGGLFSLYVFLHHHQSFQSYIAASPSIWWNDFAILKYLKNQPLYFSQPTTLWLSAGDLEKQERRFTSPLVTTEHDILQFAQDVQSQDKNHRIQLKTSITHDASHIENLFISINDAFQLSR